MTAALLEQHLSGTGIEAVVDSAGLEGPAGMPASAPAIEVMSELDLDLTGHTSRIAEGAELRSADLIVAMTDAHRSEVIRHVADAADRIPVLGVSDPFGSSVSRYRATRDQLADESRAIVRELMRNGPPPRSTG